MAFKLLILPDTTPPDICDTWPELLRKSIPGIDVTLCRSDDEAMRVIGEVDAAFGNINPELFERAKNLKWVACPRAGPRAGWYHPVLIDSDVVVTNTRGIFNDHIGAHIMSFVLAFARGLPEYIRNQRDSHWKKGYESVYLPESTAIIVGVGGIGSETARLCAAFGMNVIGVDPRREEAPVGVVELVRSESLDKVLPEGDFVIVTVPETPRTQRMFDLKRFKKMKPAAFFINIGRGVTVVLDDLVKALDTRLIRGAGLDVYEIEPLPEDHPLWNMSNVLMTPHVASNGPYLDDRRTELLIDNCQRFNQGKPLLNIVDKANWF